MTMCRYSDSAAHRFIIELNRNQNENHTAIKLPASVTTSPRRVVFVSFIGLYSSWKECPASILYPAIFILPMKERWIYQPTKYHQEFVDSVVGQLLRFNFHSQGIEPLCKYGKMTVHNTYHTGVADSAWSEFTQLLLWKDSQNLVFWMLDSESMDRDGDEENMDDSSLVAPVWRRFNERLCAMYDPVMKRKYRPLALDENWWRSTYRKHTNHMPRFGASVSCVLVELYFVRLRYDTIKEMVYQSNPDSFRIVHSCHELQKVEMDGIVHGFYPDETSNASTNVGVKKGVWMISTDYDADSKQVAW